MNIVVLAKLVPDLVEELEIDDTGTALDMSWLRLIINELDDHAIEQSILLKEKTGANVTVVAPGFEDIDDILFTAGAKGADRLIKVLGNPLAFKVHKPKVILRVGMPLFLRLMKPFKRLTKILADAVALCVHCSNVGLREGIPLFSCLAIPFIRFSEISSDAKTLGVHPAQIILRINIPLFCRLAIPIYRFHVILSHTHAAFVRIA